MRVGRIDVYEFMDSVDPQIIDFWDAYDDLFPLNTFDNDRREYASLASMISRFISIFAASHGVEITSFTDNDFLPKRLRYKTDNDLQNAKDIETTLVQGMRLS